VGGEGTAGGSVLHEYWKLELKAKHDWFRKMATFTSKVTVRDTGLAEVISNLHTTHTRTRAQTHTHRHKPHIHTHANTHTHTQHTYTPHTHATHTKHTHTHTHARAHTHRNLRPDDQMCSGLPHLLQYRLRVFDDGVPTEVYGG
jgi:hypothetical protein